MELSPSLLRMKRTPSSTPSPSAPSDEVIWKRLKEAGFDEEMIKRRDKSALVSYITKLEAELNDYQHHMGLLILEKKDWTSKHEKVKAAADLAEITYKRDQAAHLAAITEAKKREDSLTKALCIEKECRANIDKALHELRGECAETKVAAEIKLAEAEKMTLDAQKRFDEAETKLLAAEALHAEASRNDRMASRKLQEVEAREDELRRRLLHSKIEWDAKEKEVSLGRQSIVDTQKILQQEQEKLLEHQSHLNQQEDNIFKRSQELDCLRKELDAAKASIDKELTSIELQKSKLISDMSILATREEVVAEREDQLNMKERNFLAMQGNLASREKDAIEKLKSEFELSLTKRKSEFEVDLAEQREKVEAELDSKRKVYELKEDELDQKEKAIQEREGALGLQFKKIVEKEAEIETKAQLLCDKEKSVSLEQEAAEKETLELRKEREDIKKQMLELEELKKTIEDEKNHVNNELEKLAATISEGNELLILEAKLKDEIDNLRTQKMELIAESDALKAEKEKFEREWELIDLKKDNLQKEAERIAEERNAAHEYLKNERDSLKLEKDTLRNQFKHKFDSLCREKEEIMAKLESERSEWFSKIQHERDSFVEDMEFQKQELESYIQKQREEVEIYLREKEEAFKKERDQELQKICSQKEMIAKDLEYVKSEKEKLNKERLEIMEDRALRDREWSEMETSIHELDTQRKKLQEQRELLVIDKKEIDSKIQDLKELHDANIASENRALSEDHTYRLRVAQRVPVRTYSHMQETVKNGNEVLDVQENDTGHDFMEELPPKKPPHASPSTSVTSWIRKCTDVIFKRSPEGSSFDSNSRKSFENKAAQHANTSVQASISSLQELRGERVTHLGSQANDLPTGRKRRNNQSSHTGSNSQQELSDKFYKRRKQDDAIEGSPVETLSEIVGSSPRSPVDINSAFPSGQNSGDAGVPKINNEEPQQGNMDSSEHVEVTQGVMASLQSEEIV